MAFKHCCKAIFILLGFGNLVLNPAIWSKWIPSLMIIQAHTLLWLCDSFVLLCITVQTFLLVFYSGVSHPLPSHLSPILLPWDSQITLIQETFSLFSSNVLLFNYFIYTAMNKCTDPNSNFYFYSCLQNSHPTSDLEIHKFWSFWSQSLVQTQMLFTSLLKPL